MKKLEKFKAMLKVKLDDNTDKNIRFRTFTAVKEVNPECSDCCDMVVNVLGKITCAVERITPDTFKVNFSFCTAKDQYCKKYGQYISLSRLLNNGDSITFNKPTGTKVSDLLRQLILDEGQKIGISWLMKDGVNLV